MEFPGLSESIKTILIVVAGIGLTIYGGYSLIQQDAALSKAEEINVTIESTGVDTVSKKRGVDFKPTASFSYTFNGESYTSDNVYPSGITQEFNTEDDAIEILEEYSTGETVTGYINPDSPGNAFLINEKSSKPYFMIFIGIAMAGIGIVSRLRG